MTARNFTEATAKTPSVSALYRNGMGFRGIERVKGRTPPQSFTESSQWVSSSQMPMTLTPDGSAA
ncbi:hypothetical protein H6F90_24830 [Trichocoleus sp. FACHB-591]|nr:hypothetical protein [Trichocoleus sp. FACHB-591]